MCARVCMRVACMFVCTCGVCVTCYVRDHVMSHGPPRLYTVEDDV